MNYDYGIKYISKHTGLTGIEASNIVKDLRKQDLDYDLFDWETIGADLYGHGKRSKGVKSKLKSMYGISLGIPVSNIKTEIKKYSDIEVSDVMSNLMEIHSRRKPHARMIDLNLRAKKTFKPTNKIGVELWKKNPNRYDIIGIDDPI